MKQKITIYAKKEMPRREALSMIYNTLRAKGFVVEDTATAIYIKPLKAAEAVTEIYTLRYRDPAEVVRLLTSIIDASSATGIRLIPESERRRIIAAASPEDMNQVRQWIDTLDIPEPIESEYEMISIAYADVTEVTNRITEALERMPRPESKARAFVQPLRHSRQIMIFGTPEQRRMIKRLVGEINVPVEEFETKVFKLKFADPELIKEGLKDLYGQVGVVAHRAMQQITVIASPQNMAKVAEQISEWDRPLDVKKVTPRIIELRNSDPVKIANLLTKLFTGESENKPFGPLHGQLTFEPVPESRKIIVISKIPEGYDVVEELVTQLDAPQAAREE